MRFLLLFVGSMLVSFAQGQIGMGQWRMHIPASKAIDVAAGNGLVMAALGSGLVEYDIAASENRVLNNLNGLSDILVSCIIFEPQSQSFFIGYENGNIDQITSSSNVINIPAIKLAQISGSKRINKMVAVNGRVYVATGFAVVVLNPAQNEVLDTWYPTNGISSLNDVAFLHDSVYVLTNDKLYRGLASSAFLADPAQWHTDPRMPVPPAGAAYKELAVKGDDMYFSYIEEAYGGDSIMKLTPGGYEAFISETQVNFNMEVHRFEITDGLFYVYYSDRLIAFDDNIFVGLDVQFYGNSSSNIKRVIPYNGMYWVADDGKGLVRYVDRYNYSFIQQEGPPKNSFFSMSGAKDKIVVTGGTLDRVIFKYNTAGAYTFQDETWTLYDQTTQANWPELLWDVAVSSVNPDNIEQIALGSYSGNALNIIDNGQISHTYNDANSQLAATTLGNNAVCISGLQYDKDGNLWVANCYTVNPLKVLLTDGTWREFVTGSTTNGKFTTKVVIDGNNNKWFGAYENGLVGYNDNDTPENVSDDTYRILRNGEGDGNLPSNNVTAIAVDRDNEIWIGTEAGFAVLYNSDGIFTSSSYEASRILITFEGVVENLLGSTPITDIEIDGGNRKWLGTESTGIFLLSADGQDVLAQYTKENSPLISNNIMDMQFNQVSGELFIITDQGLVSFRTDASEEDLNYETTTVYPNPVKPDYFGPITIQGIRYDSDVKITDVAGNLVYQTTSNGGTATWNGKRLTGEDVASGVYLIWTATNVDKARKVGKVVVIR